MAYSYIEFSGRSNRLHDLDISVACMVLMWQANAQNPSLEMSGMLDSWMDSVAHSGSGCIDLRLDLHLANAQLRQELLLLLVSAEVDLARFSQTYPLDHLKAFLQRAKLKLTHEYKLELLRPALKSIRSVIEG